MTKKLEKLDQSILDEIKNGETMQVEFKSDENGKLNDQKVVQAAVAMANASGGRIYVGIKDNGSIVGSERVRSGFWKSENAVEGVIHSGTTPSLMTKVSFYKHEGLPIVCIHVPKSETTVGTTAGVFCKRRYDSKGQPENLPMTADEIVGGVTRLGTQDFSVSVLHDVTITDLNLDLAQATFANILKTSSEPKDQTLFSQQPLDVLRSLGLLNHSSKPNIAALLLFGIDDVLKERLPNHYVQYQVFGEEGQLYKNERFEKPIAALFSELIYLPELLRNSDEFRVKGQAVVIPEYPEDSRREAIANALVHRDYTLPSGIQIQLYENELILTNPGGFPPGVEEKNLLSAPPTPRNRRLAEAMSKLKFVESSGRGVDFIFRGQALYGRPAPDYSTSMDMRVSARLVGGKANLDFCKFIFSTVSNPTMHEVLILNALFLHRDQTLEELQQLIQKPASITQQILYSMNQKGFIEISGDRVAKYFLKGSLHPMARKAVKPERMTDKQMDLALSQILKELRRKSPMSKDELADALGLSLSQTYRLLNKLKDDKKVQIQSKLWALS